jgi:hypothetical protein
MNISPKNLKILTNNNATLSNTNKQTTKIKLYDNLNKLCIIIQDKLYNEYQKLINNNNEIKKLNILFNIFKKIYESRDKKYPIHLEYFISNYILKFVGMLNKEEYEFIKKLLDDNEQISFTSVYDFFKHSDKIYEALKSIKINNQITFLSPEIKQNKYIKIPHDNDNNIKKNFFISLLIKFHMNKIILNSQQINFLKKVLSNKNSDILFISNIPIKYNEDIMLGYAYGSFCDFDYNIFIETIARQIIKEKNKNIITTSEILKNSKNILDLFEIYYNIKFLSNKSSLSAVKSSIKNPLSVVNSSLIKQSSPLSVVNSSIKNPLSVEKSSIKTPLSEENLSIKKNPLSVENLSKKQKSLIENPLSVENLSSEVIQPVNTPLTQSEITLLFNDIKKDVDNYNKLNSSVLKNNKLNISVLKNKILKLNEYSSKDLKFNYDNGSCCLHDNMINAKIYQLNQEINNLNRKIYGEKTNNLIPNITFESAKISKKNIPPNSLSVNSLVSENNSDSVANRLSPTADETISKLNIPKNDNELNELFEEIIIKCEKIHSDLSGIFSHNKKINNNILEENVKELKKNIEKLNQYNLQKLKLKNILYNKKYYKENLNKNKIIKIIKDLNIKIEFINSILKQRKIKEIDFIKNQY